MRECLLISWRVLLKYQILILCSPTQTSLPLPGRSDFSNTPDLLSKLSGLLAALRQTNPDLEGEKHQKCSFSICEEKAV